MTHFTTHHVEHLIWHIRRLSRALAATQPNSVLACRHIDAAEQNLLEATEMLNAGVTCIGCGCSEHASCSTEDGWGCRWLIVDYEKNQGVCSECPQMISVLAESRETTLFTEDLNNNRVEWEHTQKVLMDCGGNISAAARQLNIHRRTLQCKLQRRPAKKSS